MESTSDLCLNTLPVDILIDIFKTLPDFSDARSLVLSHRAFNEVWKVNFNEIAPYIGRKIFQPWRDALNLMLEQKNLDYDVIVLPGPYLRLSVENIAQMNSNARYINRLQKTQEAWKEQWWHSKMTESEILRFHRATYRVWKFMLTLLLPKCEIMCEDFSILEIIEMQAAAREFDTYVEFPVPGFPNFSDYKPSDTISSLEGMLRRRIADFCRCDLDLDLDYVHELKGEYQNLRMQDPTVKGDKCVDKVKELMEFEKKWRVKKDEV